MLVLMRVYFEKPRTTVGWKGLINDPNLNGTYDVHEGMARAREFLLEVCGQGLPTATEFLEPFTPQYLGDVISWGAIGARTTESQPHRLMASGLSMPIGFKNGTGGSIDIAVDGIVAARSEHVFLGIDDDGYASVVKTKGNPGAHLVLRGGKQGPNYDAASVASAQGLLEARGLAPHVVVDCSHANSNKDHRQQACGVQGAGGAAFGERGGGGADAGEQHPGGEPVAGGPVGAGVRGVDHGCVRGVGGDGGAGAVGARAVGGGQPLKLAALGSPFRRCLWVRGLAGKPWVPPHPSPLPPGRGDCYVGPAARWQSRPSFPAQPPLNFSCDWGRGPHTPCQRGTPLWTPPGAASPAAIASTLPKPESTDAERSWGWDKG